MSECKCGHTWPEHDTNRDHFEGYCEICDCKAYTPASTESDEVEQCEKVECPTCQGQGWYADGPTDNPEQVQCADCGGEGFLIDTPPPNEARPEGENVWKIGDRPDIRTCLVRNDNGIGRAWAEQWKAYALSQEAKLETAIQRQGELEARIMELEESLDATTESGFKLVEENVKLKEMVKEMTDVICAFILAIPMDNFKDALKEYEKRKKDNETN